MSSTMYFTVNTTEQRTLACKFFLMLCMLGYKINFVRLYNITISLRAHLLNLTTHSVILSSFPSPLKGNVWVPMASHSNA